MKTYKILSLLGLVLVVGLSSCEDYLNKQPRLSQTNALSLSTFDGINKAMIGAYSPLYDYTWYGRNFEVTADMKGGNAKASPKNSGRFRTEYLWTNTPTATSGVWGTAYTLIARVNNIINACDGFSEIGVTQEEIDNVVGEAKFLRALAYHDLVRLFARSYAYDSTSLGVPVVLVSENGLPSRKMVKEVYAQILLDLKDAETALSATNTHGGSDAKAWAKKLSAQALTARVYLYMENWQKAADYATTVINQQSSSFKLFNPEDYTIYLSSPTTIGSTTGVWGALTGGSEVIFEIYGSEGNSSHGNWDVISYILSPNGYGDVGASNDLRNLYTDTADVRGKLFTTSIDYPNDYWSLKYPGKNGNLREDNIPVLRLAEMYLIRAEALAEGATIAGVTALSDINTLRAARNASVKTTVTLSDIYQERRRELCFEGHELFDLARTKRPLTRVDYAGTNNQDIAVDSYLWAMPIPQDEINANINCEQNPNYANN
ncbi:MAG: RagB/SusD family nutrient uptake outer membrane protein [Bacteroidales bacterium]|nr:RagB/SusD family nutrient uptake outer membrane protein [Bacteroidales bacterium]